MGRLLTHVDDEVLFSWLDAEGLPAARVAAYYLPEPRLVDGRQHLPARTERFLARFDHDFEVIEHFCHPPFTSGMYGGDIAKHMDDEAERAAPFRNHKYRAVRRWADREHEWKRASAEHWRVVDEEHDDF